MNIWGALLGPTATPTRVIIPTAQTRLVSTRKPLRSLMGRVREIVDLLNVRRKRMTAEEIAQALSMPVAQVRQAVRSAEDRDVLVRDHNGQRVTFRVNFQSARVRAVLVTPPRVRPVSQAASTALTWLAAHPDATIKPSVLAELTGSDRHAARQVLGRMTRRGLIVADPYEPHGYNERTYRAKP